MNDGGTLIVQYNKTGEFNQAQYGPYPALVSSNRVTDETAPVQILEKEHHAFTYPNRIRQDAWDGWVQERGLYFLGEKDAKYTDLVQLQDPFEYNPGMKGGALVEARLGKGRWIYVGLGLWRQLPYGTVGAYQLMANLISLGKVPKAARQHAVSTLGISMTEGLRLDARRPAPRVRASRSSATRGGRARSRDADAALADGRFEQAVAGYQIAEARFDALPASKQIAADRVQRARSATISWRSTA